MLNDVSLLVEDGRLQLEGLANSGLSPEQFLAQLRQESIRNLGEVRRAYFEVCGEFAILQFEQPQPGLSVVPMTDTALREGQEKAPGQFACGSCGQVLPSQLILGGRLNEALATFEANYKHLKELL